MNTEDRFIKLAIDINSSSGSGRKFPIPENNLSKQYLLALETSGRSGSCAVIGPDDQGGQSKIIASMACDPDSSSAKTLAPLVRDLLDKISITPSRLSAIAVTVGPGSFTGLRVGVALAKSMAYALGIRAIEIDTLHAMARQFQVARRIKSSAEDGMQSNPCEESIYHRVRLWTILDAYRGEFFVAGWNIRQKDGESILSRQSPTRIVGLDELYSMIANSFTPNEELGSEIVFAGPGVKKVRKGIEQIQNESDPSGNVSVQFDESLVATAESVAMLAGDDLKANRAVDPFALMPVYLRGSAAEEKKRR